MPAAIRRHLINSPQRVIDEALDGFARTNPQLVAWEAENNLISRRTKSIGKVGLVSGGGSGHEPLHGGFVGFGMLDVAVCGAIFASPSGAQVYAGTALANSGRGVVQIIKNYTGDVLNFQIAASLAEDDGIEVGQILVDDDLASQGDKDGPGRRGTAAVVTIEKICGALAERGAPVDLVTSLGRKLVDRSRSLAVALTAGTHPGDDRAAFELDTPEVEFGVGIHGERGTARIPFAPVDQLVEQLVAPLADSLALLRGDAVIAIVNGLGAAHPIELNIAARQVHRLLADRGITVARSLAGTYVSSLDMHGISVTLTAVDDTDIELWDEPVRTPALSW